MPLRRLGRRARRVLLSARRVCRKSWQTVEQWQTAEVISGLIRTQQKLRYAEFCSGVGGFRMGIESSTLPSQLVYVNEINDACARTYAQNFKREFDSRNLLALDVKSLPDFEMMCAGFPCQPFSIAGKELGFDDPRGGIFFKLIKIARAKKPLVVFLENVANLVRHDHGETFKRILSELEKSGYVVSHKILNSSYFGVPQSRNRIYIVGLLKTAFPNLRVDLTERHTDKTSFRKFVDRKERANPVSAKWDEYIDLYLGRRKIEDMSFEVPRTRRALERVAAGCNLNDCVLQARSSGVRALSLDDPFPTFTVLNSGGGAHIPILTKHRRYLSMGEMKSIMGFPAWYDFSAVSRTDAAKQLANAVCPPVISSVCDDIAIALRK